MGWNVKMCARADSTTYMMERHHSFFSHILSINGLICTKISPILYFIIKISLIEKLLYVDHTCLDQTIRYLAKIFFDWIDWNCNMMALQLCVYSVEVEDENAFSVSVSESNPRSASAELVAI